ncbi:MAG: hypothetical protein H0U09_14990 [Geodermatophilaceae bacterium]|nr:hypothetical protein [Geodermatophilaceae bacterium]
MATRSETTTSSTARSTAFPLGYILRHRLAAYVAVIAVYTEVFTFQSVLLLKEDPDTIGLSYLLVSSAIFGAGLGLATLGNRLAARRNARRESGALDLQAAGR